MMSLKCVAQAKPAVSAKIQTGNAKKVNMAVKNVEVRSLATGWGRGTAEQSTRSIHREEMEIGGIRVDTAAVWTDFRPTAISFTGAVWCLCGRSAPMRVVFGTMGP